MVKSQTMVEKPWEKKNKSLVTTHRQTIGKTMGKIIYPQKPWEKTWKIPYKWRFLAGKIIYKWAIYTMAMLNNQRVKNRWKTMGKTMGKTIYPQKPWEKP